MTKDGNGSIGPRARAAVAQSNRILREKLRDSLERMPGGDRIDCCIQCGTCGGSCPVSWAMDYTPREIINLFRTRDMDTILKSTAIWICSSCYQCAARCPSDIKITDLMYALKRLAIDQGISPNGFSGHLFSQAFVEQVRKYGRNYEAGLIGKYFMRSGIFQAIKRAPSGWRMFRKGRLMIRPRKIKDLDALRRIIARAEQMDMVREPSTEKKIVDAVGYEAI